MTTMIERAEREYQTAERSLREAEGWLRHTGSICLGTVQAAEKRLTEAGIALSEAKRQATTLGQCGWCCKPAERRVPINAGGVTVQVNICSTHG